MARYFVKPWPGLRHAVIDSKTNEPVNIYPEASGAQGEADRRNEGN